MVSCIYSHIFCLRLFKYRCFKGSSFLHLKHAFSLVFLYLLNHSFFSVHLYNFQHSFCSNFIKDGFMVRSSMLNLRFSSVLIKHRYIMRWKIIYCCSSSRKLNWFIYTSWVLKAWSRSYFFKKRFCTFLTSFADLLMFLFWIALFLFYFTRLWSHLLAAFKELRFF